MDLKNGTKLVRPTRKEKEAGLSAGVDPLSGLKMVRCFGPEVPPQTPEEKEIWAKIAIENGYPPDYYGGELPDEDKQED